MTPLHPATAAVPPVAPWQRALRDAVRDPAELLALLELDGGEHAHLLAGALGAAQTFALRAPRGFVARMHKGDPRDPLLLQVLPLQEELAPSEGYGFDPVGDLAAMSTPGVLRKYRGRALLTITGACAVHCRYCFRRHFPYAEANPAQEHWERALETLARDPSIAEVILSGGDPLELPDERLAGLARRLAAIPHLKRLRVHTRLPVVLPERIGAALLDWLCGTRLQPVLVIHANHPREVDGAVRAALQPLRERGVTLLNQSVLLRGINDDARVLADLSEALFAAGVLPYYLHLLDRVAGAAHFDVAEAEARRIMIALRTALPGYLVPRLVREVEGAPFKLPL